MILAILKQNDCRRAVLLLTAFLFVSVNHINAQTPDEYFKQNCVSCHTVGGGRLTGPDLKNVNDRQSRDWLVNWLMDPQGILAGGDPYALTLQKEARGAVMTNSPGMTKVMANALLDLMAAESKLEKSQFAGMQIADRPLLPSDIVEGEALFTGKKRLLNGGPACIGCHTVNSMTGFGGGLLGLNLTRAFARLGGQKALSTWLVAPPGLTMNPIFKTKPIADTEILPIVAFLKNETEMDKPLNTASMVNFLLFGIVGAVILLVVFDLLWNKRFRGVRKAMVQQKKLT
ncbi:MAG: cytochrome c family protein [Calditrichaceae bacterium]